MTGTIEIAEDGTEQRSLKAYTEEAYLNYSMYVINDRALPHIGDGLKPVQRRIVYAMSELGLKAVAKYKKSARTIGDVIGKYHPHGDSACYEAMVLMAQDFSYRYPLVDGQGNWGSPDDPKSFAAMRYTEAKLRKYSELLLQELAQGTVDWKQNFDGEMEEPMVFPARLPNVLLNGVTGIAVGMATDIPPHNLKEVASACLRLLDEPKADINTLCEHIKGPDYPTEAEIITPREDILKLYETGRGSIKCRAVYQTEGADIVLTALPHQVSGAKVQEQIALQMQSKKLPMVVDLRDESDHENPTRIIITMRSNRVDESDVMNHLFATTDLEKNYRVNLNMIGIDGRPKVKNLAVILKEWISFRIATVTRRLQYRLEKVNKRLHILDAYLIAFLNIDEVIKIIRGKDKPKPVLMKRFKLSDVQAEAILDLKLRHLARLEEVRIKGEQDELSKERDQLQKTLKSKTRLKSLIKKEILADADAFGDDRLSPIVIRKESKAFSETELLSSDPVTIVLSDKGWIRLAKGHEVDATALNYKSGDKYKFAAVGKTNQSTVILDSAGRTYTVATHTLPSARGQGEPLTGRISPPSGVTFEGLMVGQDDEQYLLATDAGYGFVVNYTDMQSKNKAGKAILSLPKGARVLPPAKVFDQEEDTIISITNEGRMLAFPVAELPVLSKGKGNKIISIPPARVVDRIEYVIAVTVISEKDILVVYAGRRHLKLKMSDLEHYYGERGRRGNKLPRGFQKVDDFEIIRASNR